LPRAIQPRAARACNFALAAEEEVVEPESSTLLADVKR